MKADSTWMNQSQTLRSSFGSNCEVARLLQIYYGSIQSNLFNWANIDLQNLCLILEDVNCLSRGSIEMVFRCFDGPAAHSYDTFEEAQQYCLENHQIQAVSIDYNFVLYGKKLFWNHAISGINSSEFALASIPCLETWKSSLLGKHEHLTRNTIKLLTLENIPVKLFIKALKNEYTDALIVRAHNLISRGRSNAFLGVIYEAPERSEINISLPNTLLIRAEQLTPHDGAIYSEAYGTTHYYASLFEKIDSMCDASTL